tara:strand:+ start:198 stop:530 length:333 start_codon:yes stop_codon:yes gene_type:complete
MSAVQVKSDRIKIKLKGYDYKLLDRSVKEIVDTVKRAGAEISGPIPVKVKRERFTILKSPHVNKDARDQLEIRTHGRLIYIIRPDGATIDALQKLNLASGIDIQISVDEE